VRCGELNGCDEPVEVVALGFRDDLETAVARLRRRNRADAHTGKIPPQRYEGPRSRGRGEDDQVGLGKRLGLHVDGAVQRDELGTKLADEYVTGVFGGCVQDAAGRLWKLLGQPFLGRALGDEGWLDVVRFERLSGPRADRRDLVGPAVEPPQKRLDGVPARDEDPVIALGLDSWPAGARPGARPFR
jgi:hypothetical protein